MDDFAQRRPVRVVVLTGAGGKAFVSGADISKFGDERSNEEAVAHYNATVEKASRALYDLPEADDRDDPRLLHRRRPRHRGLLRHAHRTENSRFAVPAAKLGLGYGYSGVKRLVDIVGPSFTKEIFFTAASSTPRRRMRWASSTAWCRTPSSKAT